MYAIGGDCVVCRATGSPRRSSSGTTIWQRKVIIPGAGVVGGPGGIVGVMYLRYVGYITVFTPAP